MDNYLRIENKKNTFEYWKDLYENGTDEDWNKLGRLFLRFKQEWWEYLKTKISKLN